MNTTGKEGYWPIVQGLRPGLNDGEEPTPTAILGHQSPKPLPGGASQCQRIRGPTEEGCAEPRGRRAGITAWGLVGGHPCLPRHGTIKGGAAEGACSSAFRWYGHVNGSLTLYFADQKLPGAPDGNWLPTPKGQAYNLTFRFYRPQGAVAERTYFPPPLVKGSIRSFLRFP